MDKMHTLDLGYQGQAFTWSGKRADGVLIQERLDRGLINTQWQEEWPNSSITHLPVMGSDHCPIFLETESRIRRGFKPFKFEVFWTYDPECREVVDRSWRREFHECLCGEEKTAVSCGFAKVE